MSSEYERPSSTRGLFVCYLALAWISLYLGRGDHRPSKSRETSDSPANDSE